MPQFYQGDRQKQSADCQTNSYQEKKDETIN